MQQTQIQELKKIVGTDHVLTSPEDLYTYSYDATPGHAHMPDAVVIPGNAEEVSQILKVANANKISQYLGVAKSATELVTDDDGYVVL